MYSIFFSRIEEGIDYISDRLKEIIDKESKVVILPWSFPVEIDADTLENDFFAKGGKRYNRYINSLQKIDINEKNIIICNCYSQTKDEIRKIINESDVLFLPGGNPEMFFKKVVQDTELLYDIKKYNKIIIGESAGAELQLRRYFITAKNNYYKHFAYYDGFGIIDDLFYLDVHTINNKQYLNKLQNVANTTNKIVYAIYNNGSILFNRETMNIEFFGNTKLFVPKKTT